MYVEIRIYKRFDTDLLALHDAGFSVTKMMEDAVYAYAHGQPFHLFLDEIVPFDMNDKNSIRLRLRFKNNDMNVRNLIYGIKHGYRSNFCKQILRNALINQHLSCYFADDSLSALYDLHLRTINVHAFPFIKNCSEYKRKNQKIKFLDQEVTITHEDGRKVSLGPASPVPKTKKTVPSPERLASPKQKTTPAPVPTPPATTHETKPVQQQQIPAPPVAEPATTGAPAQTTPKAIAVYTESAPLSEEDTYHPETTGDTTSQDTTIDTDALMNLFTNL